MDYYNSTNFHVNPWSELLQADNELHASQKYIRYHGARELLLAYSDPDLVPSATYLLSVFADHLKSNKFVVVKTYPSDLIFPIDKLSQREASLP